MERGGHILKSLSENPRGLYTTADHYLDERYIAPLRPLRTR